jgi:hypothetical protein
VILGVDVVTVSFRVILTRRIFDPPITSELAEPELAANEVVRVLLFSERSKQRTLDAVKLRHADRDV